MEDEMTDYQFKKLLEMVMMLLEDSDNLDQAKQKVVKLLEESE